MQLQAVAAAIRSRMASDSTLVNSLVGSSSRILLGQLPSDADASGNYLVFNLFGDGVEDVADQDIEACRLEFTVVVGRDAPDDALLILDQLHGDGVDQAGNEPTYGFHRKTELTLSGAAGTTHRAFGFRRESYGPIDTDDPEQRVAYGAVYRFEISTK